jgi:hypothetical protein
LREEGWIFALAGKQDQQGAEQQASLDYALALQLQQQEEESHAAALRAQQQQHQPPLLPAQQQQQPQQQQHRPRGHSRGHAGAAGLKPFASCLPSQMRGCVWIRAAACEDGSSSLSLSLSVRRGAARCALIGHAQDCQVFSADRRSCVEAALFPDPLTTCAQ